MEPLRHGVTYATEESLFEVAGWLEKNCKGEWKIEFEEDSVVSTTLNILFERDTDRVSFIEDFA